MARGRPSAQRLIKEAEENAAAIARGEPPPHPERKVEAKERVEAPAAAPFVGSPEFNAAVAAAAADIKKELMATLAPAAATGEISTAGMSPDVAKIFQGLALAIAEVGDQGTGRKRIDPQELAARKTAHDLCVSYIKDARDNKIDCEYRVIGKIFFNEQFIEPFKMGSDKKPVPNEIIWSGMPNDGLHPLNDPARKIFLAWRRSVGMPELISTDNYASQPFWVTANGLVVKGEAPAQKRAVAADPVFSDELKIPSMPNDPTAPEVRVLGSIAAPARQNISANQ